MFRRGQGIVLLSRRVGCAAAALLAAVLASACGRREPLRHLPLLEPEMLKVGVEARPARRIAHDHQVSWTIPASSAATLELACALAEDDTESDVSAVFHVYRERNDRKKLLRRIAARRGERSGWIEAAVAWPAHGKPVTLTVEVEARYRGQPVADPATSHALLAEPILATRGRPASGTSSLALFLIDTLRADRLGCYGGPAATPEIDRLAREGLRVERVLSTSSWTLPAHASLFTSTSVARHGAGGGEQADRVLGSELPTLAETLRAGGFRTLAVTNGVYVDPIYGIARGFDRYLTLDIEKEDVRQTLARAVELVRRYRNDNWFLFFHTYQVHQYLDLADRGGMATANRPENVQRLTCEYDEQLSFTDAALGDLRGALSSAGLGRRTAVILTSDHGEVLDDRPEDSPEPVFGHRHPYLHDEEVCIPLVVFDPSRPAGRVLPGPASLLDIAPTVLETLGQPPQPAFEGVALRGPRERPEGQSPRLFVAECPPLDALALERGGRKLILRPLAPTWNWTTGGLYPPFEPVEAYDLTRDPRERVNRAGDASFVDELRREAHRVVAAHFPGSVVVRAPPSIYAVTFRLDAPSGLRAVSFFRPKPSDFLELAEGGGRARGAIDAGSTDVWLVARPRRPLDLVRIALTRGRGVGIALGSGKQVPPGETRVRWKALLLGDDPLPTSEILVSASSVTAGTAQPAPSPPLDAERIAQLRSLGYLAMPQAPGRELDDSAPVPMSLGPDLVLIDVANQGR